MKVRIEGEVKTAYCLLADVLREEVAAEVNITDIDGVVTIVDIEGRTIVIKDDGEVTIES